MRLHFTLNTAPGLPIFQFLFNLSNYLILGNMMHSLFGTATLTGYKCDSECNEALTNCNMYYVMYKKAKEAVKLTVS